MTISCSYYSLILSLLISHFAICDCLLLNPTTKCICRGLLKKDTFQIQSSITSDSSGGGVIIGNEKSDLNRVEGRAWRFFRQLIWSAKFHFANLLLSLVRKLIGIPGIREIGRNRIKENDDVIVYTLQLENDNWYIGRSVST